MVVLMWRSSSGGGGSPGQTTVLLQGRFSRRGPVHWVVKEEVAQRRVRLCQPSPQDLNAHMCKNRDQLAQLGCKVHTQTCRKNTVMYEALLPVPVIVTVPPQPIEEPGLPTGYALALQIPWSLRGGKRCAFEEKKILFCCRKLS